jgi:hypothetical protein
MEPNGARDVLGPVYSNCEILAAGALGMNATRVKKVETLDTPAPDPKSVEAIGRALEKHYASLIQEPLPDKFMELLARLEREQAPEAPQTPERPDALD